MKRSLVLALAVALLGLVACGGGGNEDAAELRGELNALRQQLATSSTTASSSTTTTTVEPTTATTIPVRQPQGTVEWSRYREEFLSPPCVSVQYLVQNKSDTAVLNVTLSGVRIGKNHPDPSHERVLHGPAFPAQTQAAGIPPWGENYVTFKFCRNDWPKDPLSYNQESYMDIGDWEARMTWEWAS